MNCYLSHAAQFQIYLIAECRLLQNLLLWINYCVQFLTTGWLFILLVRPKVKNDFMSDYILNPIKSSMCQNFLRAWHSVIFRWPCHSLNQVTFDLTMATMTGTAIKWNSDSWLFTTNCEDLIMIHDIED